jgi:hypothetical protein
MWRLQRSKLPCLIFNHTCMHHCLHTCLALTSTHLAQGWRGSECMCFPSEQVFLGAASTAAAPAPRLNEKALMFTTSFPSRDADSFPFKSCQHWCSTCVAKSVNLSLFMLNTRAASSGSSTIRSPVSRFCSHGAQSWPNLVCRFICVTFALEELVALVHRPFLHIFVHKVDFLHLIKT